MSVRAPAATRTRWGLALATVTLLGGVLRLDELGAVPLNTFYDAAVRSMGLSWHNLIYGAFDPSASASIDKPPFDLWLQVLSVKLFGFHSAALKYPSALAGTVAVPLLYAVVRRVAGRPAALASAFSLAIMPISVLTSRSDTMDSLMMALLVATAWLIVRAHETGRRRELLAAAVTLGAAFDVKLFEALIAAPALLALAWPLLWPGGWRARPAGRVLAGVAVAFAVSAFAWMAFVAATPRGDRPYPIGSTDGSIWNAVFVFNGADRLTKTPHPDRFSAPAAVELASQTPMLPAPHHHRRAASQAPAGPLRLFEKSSQDYGGVVGVQLLGALLLGAAALLAGGRAPLAGGSQSSLARAGAICVGVWLLTGLVLFSGIGRLHPRYLEAFTPAVAAGLGCGAMLLAGRGQAGAPGSPSLRALAALGAGLLLVFLEGVRITGVGKIVADGRYLALLMTAVALVAMAVVAALARETGRWPAWCRPAWLGALTVAAIAPFPLARDLRLIRHHNGDQALAPPVPARVVAGLSGYLRAHTAGLRYEVAASAPSLASPLIIRDARPVLLLTTVDGRALASLAALRDLAARGQVAYVVTRGRCPRPRNHRLAACSEAVRWVVAHGRDVSAEAVPGERGLLYRLG